jgi:iron complex transport system ATP-binding protein
MTILLDVSALEIAAGHRTLVSKLDLRIHRGEFWCVLGKNGTGKTTLIQTFAGLRHPSRGQIRLCSDLLQTIPSDVLARRRGLLPQQVIDVFAHTVFEAVVIGRVPGRISRSTNLRSDEEAVDTALARVGLSGIQSRNVLTLSGGERQRVALAALLVQSPELMLLDEPLSHQDISQQFEVMQLLRELSEHHAVVSSCHDVNLAKRFATHALVLGEGCHCMGKVEDTLTPERLSAAFGCQFVQEGDWLVPG